MLYFVYELIDPRTDQTFYIGITNHPNGRMMQHLTAKDTNKMKIAKISELQSENLLPKMNIIEIVEGKEKALTRERYYIHTYVQQHLLTNIQYMPLPQTAKDSPVQARSTPQRKQKEVLFIDLPLEGTSSNYIERIKLQAKQIIPGDYLDPGEMVTEVKRGEDFVWIISTNKKSSRNRMRCRPTYELHILPRSASH